MMLYTLRARRTVIVEATIPRELDGSSAPRVSDEQRLELGPLSRSAWRCGGVDEEMQRSAERAVRSG
jgi:hypothetical protein